MASFRALSKEGHAAMSMRDSSDRWILIQKNTFTNWVNEQLRVAGVETTDFVRELENDFETGVKLCQLVEGLQGKKVGRIIKNPLNHHQRLENVTIALNAIANDNVRLVNIGPEDIVNGNLKLILGLIWHLILRYQIGKTKFPTKKLMLAWLQAVIPECAISNFTTDWNSGVALHALIDYCRPGLCPNWRQMSRSDGLNNCKNAMELAKREFDIPLVVRPEDLSSPDLDELSGMTYLSYFMKVDSPGYYATMNMVRKLLKSGTVNNFTSDWSDGRLLCNLCVSSGATIPGWPNLNGSHVEVQQLGIDAAKRMGVEPILTAKEMCDPEVDHIGIMAYAAYFSRFKPFRAPAEKVVMDVQPKNCYIGITSTFSVRIEDDDISSSDIRADLKGPDSNPPVTFSWAGRVGTASFTPVETGIHRLNVYCENQLIVGCPISFKVLADRSKVTFSSIDHCAVGMITELKVNSQYAGQGDVQVEARAPGGRVHNLRTVYRNGDYVINFTPSEVGVWKVSVHYEGDHISGSPFNIKVFDPNAVRVFELEGGTVGMGLNFMVDTSEAGEGDLRVTVTHNYQQVPAYITHQRAGLYRVDFTPEGAGTYKVNVFYNDIEVRGSPYTLDIVDSGRVTVSGDGLSLVPVNRTARFEVDTQGSSSGKVNVEITAPSGKNVLKKIESIGNGKFQVEYTPFETGDHQIMVYYCDQPVKGGPFSCKVYDAGQVIVSHMPSHATVNQPVSFNIDASEAGSGNIEIMVNKGRIACNVQNLGSYKFLASFVPTKVEKHTIEMKFNNLPVIGSPWHVQVTDPKSISVTGGGIDFILCNRKTNFVVNCDESMSENISVLITGPSGQSVPCDISNGSQGQIVEYVPTEVGDHKIFIKYRDTEIEGSPFTAKAYDTSAIAVTPLQDGMVGSPVEFTIDVTRAGEGQLEIMVNNGNLRNTVDMERAGVYRITFTPEEAGRQYVNINFNSEGLPGSPFSCLAVDAAGATISGLKTALPANKLTTFTIETPSSATEFSAVVDITTPNGNRIPARIMSQADGSFKVEWTPTSTGRHTVEVQYAGRQIDGSPFYVDVFDLAMIRVEHFKQGGIGQTASFDIDFSQVGVQDYSVVIRSPTGNIMDYNSTSSYSDVRKEITYVPTEVGQHEIYINYCGFELPGCPVIHTIDEGGLPSASGPGLYKGQEDKEAVFYVDVGKRSGDLDIKVEGPNSIAKTTVERAGEKFIVNYTPVEVGIFNIGILWNGTPIPGSPFHPKVFDPRKVRISGGWAQYMDGNERVGLVVGEEKRLVFDVSQAGPGSLRAEVVGPGSAVPATVTDSYGQTLVAFVPKEEGNHYIHLYWSDVALPNSPFLGYAVPAFSDANKVILTGRGLKEATVREEAEFVIDGSQAGPEYLQQNSAPEVTLTGVRAEINVKVVNLGGGKHRCTYIPVVPGAYLLNITWNGRQLRGSPYKVNVVGTFYPNKVNVSGEGLRGGILGRSMDVAIDTRKAGPGELTAYCMGPSKASYCELQDNHDGTFILKIKPHEPGKHVLQVKYGGEHVNGSPFVLKVNAQPDASKVRVTGPGVEHGILATFQSRFIVETRGAGAGQLTVRIRGPKGGFQVEMYRDSQRDRTILCRYDPTETGLYIISVRWSGVDVPGSPFQIHIVDTQQELEQILHDQSFSHSSVTPRSYAQWREEI
ncbi:filamin-A-like isoform X4 [Saccostrea echinata]|uniref:filamin-A-like isoform X4 n=1 Tax=Saccostrea echinata TaxID=191078 RepID=UPI002A80C81A|nr:filamin-A-like isoform X4 [Saccostrea echinata]